MEEKKTLLSYKPGTILQGVYKSYGRFGFLITDDDHEDVDPSEYTTEDEKRVKQLKSMLKNGIIDREEYHILMDRFGL